MKIVAKLHKAKVVNSKKKLTLSLLDKGTVFGNPELLKGHEKVQIISMNLSRMNKAMEEIAIRGKKSGDIVQVLLKYLVD